ncbi:MAG TPA: DegT/DnrJ/EryC1/StrS family aminotransferase [bacterium]|nr:DegT/DnrJ/EryC1/StrS family aminotransferase [bacterium]HPJ71983.1 DegT/DnrJ/EryC1/StrS family aminotransferase [bacterium]
MPFPRFRVSMPLSEIPRFLGPVTPGAVGEFARAFRKFGGFGPVFPTDSGRSAFKMILAALEPEPGAEIVFPAYTFHPMPVLAAECGLVPVFADVEPGTWNLSPESFAAAVTSRTRAVVPTHLFGVPARMDEIAAAARARGIAVVEDCAHALGADYHGRPAGNSGDAAVFTFAPSKNLPCWGGGMIAANNPELAARLEVLTAATSAPPRSALVRRHFGNMAAMLATHPLLYGWTLYPITRAAARSGRDPFETKFIEEAIPPRPPTVRPPGPERSFRGRGLSPVQAAAGLRQLRRFPRWLEIQRAHARFLRHRLENLALLQFQQEPPGASSSFLYLRVRVEDPGEVRRRLLLGGVDTKADDMRDCSSLPFFHAASCPVAARLGGHCIELPCSPLYSAQDIENIARRIIRSLR